MCRNSEYLYRKGLKSGGFLHFLSAFVNIRSISLNCKKLKTDSWLDLEQTEFLLKYFVLNILIISLYVYLYSILNMMFLISLSQNEPWPVLNPLPQIKLRGWSRRKLIGGRGWSLPFNDDVGHKA